MTVAYLDASALVKLVLEEDGSDDVRLLWDGAVAVFASHLADVEVVAALAAARRAQRLGDRALRDAIGRWSTLGSAIQPVELTADLAAVASRLAVDHALGGADAIHLASALVLADASPVVATWDARLHAAVRASGLATMPA